MQGSLGNPGHPFPSHIFSGEMIFLVSQQVGCSSTCLLCYQFAEAITTGFDNPGYLRGEGDTLIPQALSQPKQCLVCW